MPVLFQSMGNIDWRIVCFCGFFFLSWRKGGEQMEWNDELYRLARKLPASNWSGSAHSIGEGRVTTGYT